MGEKGLRILAFATRRLAANELYGALEQDLVFLGLVGLEDPPRPEVPEAVRKCRDAEIKVIMVTGDHPHTAVAIAREIGLVRSRDPMTVSGDQRRKLSGPELEQVLSNPEVIFARVAPDQKMRIVEALKSNRHVVAVTGDGVNDAPALKAAHIGIAMGITGADVARAASDMVLLDDNFASIVSAVEEGRAVFQNIRKFLTYVLVNNVAELVPYVAFALFRIPLPLTPIQALAIDMGTDSLTALGLGVEEPHPQAMLLPPRWQHERLLNFPLALRAYIFLGVIEAAAAMAAFFFLLCADGCRLDLWANDGAKRSGISERHHGLPQRHHCHADRQCIFVPKLRSIGVFYWDMEQPFDPLGRGAGDPADPANHLHAMGQFPAGNRRCPWRVMVVYHALCRGDARPGGTAQMGRPPDPP
jgi:magnesium-transporting ATPase (P-type)